MISRSYEHPIDRAAGRASEARLEQIEQTLANMQETRATQDPNVLSLFVRYGHKARTLAAQIKKLEQQDKAGKAGLLETFLSNARSQPHLAAAFRQLSQQGDAEIEDFQATENFLGKNPSVHQTVLDQAMRASHKVGRFDLGPGMFSIRENGKVKYNSSGLLRVVHSMSIEDWGQLRPDAVAHMASSLGYAAAHTEDAVLRKKTREVLSQLNDPNSKLSVDKRVAIQGVVDSLSESQPPPGRDEGYL